LSSGYTPLFQSLTSGTLYGRWPDIGMFPIVLSLADRHGVVDVLPAYLAGVTGLALEEVVACMKRFCEPDPHSRSSDEGGARLALIDPANRDWGWRVINHGKYRDRARKMSSDAERAQDGRNLKRMAARRASRADPTRPAQTRADPPSDSDKTKTQTVNSNCEQAHPRGSRSGSRPQPLPSDDALARALEGRCNITREDLLSNWLTWAASKKGPFHNIDKAFLTWCAKHEPTAQQRKSAIAKSRGNSSSKPRPVAELLKTPRRST
jgi:hypothetical protein